MKSVLVAMTALVSLALGGCGDDDSPVAVDPGSGGSPSVTSPATSPTASGTVAIGIPEAPPAPTPSGEVTTRGLVTVISDDERATPELCLGPVAESYPPMCSGPPIQGWDWDTMGSGIHETQGTTRWGSYLVTGSWDGATFTAGSAIPSALYDAAAPTPTPTPPPASAYPDAELEQIANEVGAALPGSLGAFGGAGSGGHVLADVVYDDGSLQAWADATYGAGVVLVSSALVDRD